MGSICEIENILIAGSQFLIVEALKSVLCSDQRFAAVKVAEDNDELKQALEEKNIDFLIVDVSSFDFENISDFIILINKHKPAHVLILANVLGKADFVELSKAGYTNILLKNADKDEFFQALDSTLKGKKYYSPELLDQMMDLYSAKKSNESNKALTSAELEIVRLISQGFTTKEIAAKKNISFHTVTTHRKNIFRKLEVSNVSELVMQAIKLGWIDPIEYYI